jgi:hypothetical protein
MPDDVTLAKRIIAMASIFEEYSAGDVERRLAEKGDE